MERIEWEDFIKSSYFKRFNGPRWPLGLKRFNLNDVPITEFNLDKFQKFKKTIHYIRYKAKKLRPITDEMNHLFLTPQENSKVKVRSKYGGVQLKEFIQEIQ